MSRIHQLALLLSLVAHSAVAADRPNILFIAIDDLRPELGCYGQSQIHSPNIDALARRSLRFNRAYCMVPTCGASRAALFTGLRPTAKRFTSYLTYAEKDAPGIVTMNTHFRNNGYHTASVGKVLHHPSDSAQGWTDGAWRPRGKSTYKLPENAKIHARNARGKTKPTRGPAYESADVPDSEYADGAIADRAIQDLRRFARQDEPFFFAVGFLKPHLPFVAPKKYWDLYDEASIIGPKDYHPPKDAPAESIHTFGEMRAYHGIPNKGPVSDETARKLIHGYCACVSFTDAQIGRVLGELDSLGLSENTIVVLWGDHGWNLGEHTLWCKHSCYDVSMRIPLLVSVPGKTDGKHTEGLTETIDIYPSLCELADLPQPEHLQGDSFVPLLSEPSREWKAAAHGRFKNGDTVRTEQFRYTQYRDRKGAVSSTMMYDHASDPGENQNVVDREDLTDSAREHAKRVEEMIRKLKTK